MSGNVWLLLVLLLCVLVLGSIPAQAGEPRYGVLLGTFSGKNRGIDAWRKLRDDKNLTGASLVLARQKGAYGNRPGYILVAGPFSFASKAQRLGKRLERSGRLVRTVAWPEPGAVVAARVPEAARQKACRLPAAPPDPKRSSKEDAMRRSLTSLETEGGSKFSSDLYYDDGKNEVGNSTSMEGEQGRVANKLYTEFKPEENMDLAVRGEILAEAPVGTSKIKGVVDYGLSRMGQERVALSHVWQPDKAVETEVGVASEIGANPERNAFGSVSRKLANGLRLTQRMDVYEGGEIKTFSGIGIAF